MARRKKKPVHKVVMTEGKRQIIQQLLQEYDIETAEDIQDALKELLGGTIKEMMVPPRWITISDTKNPSAPTPTTIATATKKKLSTPATVLCGSMSHRTASPHLIPKLSKSGRKTSLTLTRKLSPCMPRG